MPAERVQSVFSTLHRLAPHMASDPNVAGTFVRHNLRLNTDGNIELGGLQSLISANKSVGEQRSLPLWSPKK